MELPTWLEAWWAFWADFTDLVWWPAWAAAFTGAALWNTARLADRGARDTRRKEAVFVMAVRELLSDFVYEVADFEARVDTLKKAARSSGSAATNHLVYVDRVRNIVEETWADGKIIEQIEAIRLVDFPTVETFVIFSTAKIDIYLIKESLASYDGTPESAANLKAECDALADRIDQLKVRAQDIAPFHVRTGGVWARLARLIRHRKPASADVEVVAE